MCNSQARLDVRQRATPSGGALCPVWQKFSIFFLNLKKRKGVYLTMFLIRNKNVTFPGLQYAILRFYFGYEPCGGR